MKKILAAAALTGAALAATVAPASAMSFPLLDGQPGPGNSSQAPGQEAKKNCANEQVKYYLDLTQEPLDAIACVRILKK